MHRSLLDLGIETRIHYVPPVHLHPHWARQGFREGAFPVAERVSAELLCLPCHPGGYCNTPGTGRRSRLGLSTTRLNSLQVGQPETPPSFPQPIISDPFAFHFGLVDGNNPATPTQFLVARLRLLEGWGVARTLANPRAVVMEGRPGKLVVGGELPVPIVGPDRTVTIQFKEFGIRLEFCANSVLKRQGDQLECVRDPAIGTGDGVTLDLRTEGEQLGFCQRNRRGRVCHTYD